MGIRTLDGNLMVSVLEFAIGSAWTATEFLVKMILVLVQCIYAVFFFCLVLFLLHNTLHSVPTFSPLTKGDQKCGLQFFCYMGVFGLGYGYLSLLNLNLNALAIDKSILFQT